MKKLDVQCPGQKVLRSGIDALRRQVDRLEERVKRLETPVAPRVAAAPTDTKETPREIPIEA